jgi:hypothetical protein
MSPSSRFFTACPLFSVIKKRWHDPRCRASLPRLRPSGRPEATSVARQHTRSGGAMPPSPASALVVETGSLCFEVRNGGKKVPIQPANSQSLIQTAGGRFVSVLGVFGAQSRDLDTDEVGSMAATATFTLVDSSSSSKPTHCKNGHNPATTILAHPPELCRRCASAASR